MSAIYSKATPDVAERAKALIEKHHFELEQHKLRIDFIFANSAVDDEGRPTGPAVSHGGYAALAVARNLSTKDRVMGRGDCEIDGEAGPDFAFSHTIIPVQLSSEQSDDLLKLEKGKGRPVPRVFNTYMRRKRGEVSYGNTQTTPYDEPLKWLLADELLPYMPLQSRAYAYVEAAAADTKIALYWS